MDAIVPEASWDGVRRAIAAAAKPATVYVVGPSDAGKSTLVRHLVDLLSADRKAAHLDCDPGQSSVGPPTTIGLLVHDRAAGLTRERLRFVGSLSPADHPAATLKAMARQAVAAREAACDVLVVDSSGFVDGEHGRRFQQQALRLLHPQVVVVIAPGRWSEGLDEEGEGDRRLVVIPPSTRARSRTAAERREYRRRSFAGYFAGATACELRLGSGPLAPNLGRLAGAGGSRDLLLALLDAQGFVLSLARLVHVDPRGGLIRVVARPFAPQLLRSVGIGDISLPDLGAP